MVVGVVDVEVFKRDGFVKVEQAAPTEIADAARDLLWTQIGLSPDEPESWPGPVVWTADLTGSGPFRHLVGNALKFTADGGRVELHLAATAEELLAEVRDNGVGIAPEHQARLFEGFRQGDMSSTRVAGGLGLGLAIARAMVSALGGTIGVKSAPGEGSTFWLRLPLQEGRVRWGAKDGHRCSPNSQRS